MTAAIPEGVSIRPALAPRPFRRLIERPWLACAAMFVLTLAIRIALLPWLPVPKPAVHDEFSYLLAADTYASGRLTNPPHKFWEHFETFHVLQQPTYASKYPPMQGLVLALGQKLFGEPWVGVLLSTAFLCAAVCWMLQGWTSPGAAIMGGLIVVAKIGIYSYWVNTYWGGSVPAIGGVLVVGALPRIARRGQYGHAVTWAAGFAILMNSRPYEGAILGVASVLALAWWLRKEQAPWRVVLRRVAIPAAAILAMTVGAMAYYNYRVTGSALSLPYQVHDRQYAMASMFAWSPTRPEPPYRHAVMREFWAVWHVNEVNSVTSAILTAFVEKLLVSYIFFFGLWPLLIAPLIWPYATKTLEERLVLILLVLFLASIFPITGFQLHYVAVFMCVLYLRFLQTFDRLWAWRPHAKPIGPALVAFFMTLFAFQFAVESYALAKNGPYIAKLSAARDDVIRRLQAHPGKHLVLVRYSAEHSVHQEWVYNRASIDTSPIVWAREMGSEQDRPFIDYFHDRQVWLLEPDRPTPRLVPYSSGVWR